MTQLKKPTAEDIQKWSRDHYMDMRQHPKPLEEVAQQWTQLIFEQMRQPNGDPSFALVRIFHIGQGENLPPGVQAGADEKNEHWMSLAGTYGVEPEWCDRRQSKAHKAFTASSHTTAMLKFAFDNIMALKQFDTENPDIQTGSHQTGSSFFCIPDAQGSAHIPDQANFVKPYDIQSVVGFGNLFRDNMGAILFAFTLEPFNDQDAENFAAMGPYLMTSLASANKPGNIWV